MPTYTYRMLPPNAVAQQTISAKGRTHTAAPGVAVDVPDFDASILEANSWVKVALSGPTSARPSPLLHVSPPYLAVAGFHFFDSTLGYIVIYDGLNWKNPASGATV